MNTLTLVLLSFVNTVVASPEIDPAEAIKARKLAPGVIELHVADLHCKHCAKKLARKLYATPGVRRVKTYVSKDVAVIELQPKKEVDLAKLWRAAESAEQKPIALLIASQKLVAKDFPAEQEAANKKTAKSATPPALVR